MTDYIILLIVAIIVLSLTLVLSAKKNISSSVPIFAVIGLLIALTGTFIGRNSPFYYTVLIMFGLAFAFSILLDKRLSKNEIAEAKQKTSSKVKPQVESELEKFVKMEETAASVEEDDFTGEYPVDEDLKLWMSDDLKETSFPVGEEVNRGK